jgi:hypothetical protein
LDEGVELNKGVRAAVGAKVLLRRIDICEFRRKVGEVGKSEFARIGDLTDAQEAD